MKKLITTNTLKLLKKKNKVISLCHGVFDILHVGHLNYFKSARKLSDVLVVSVTSDPFVNKGPDRPINKLQKRLEMLSSIDLVDYVIKSDEESAVKVIKFLKPNYYVKGPDYKNKKKDLSKKIFFEEKAVKENGGKLIITKDPVLSSSKIINIKYSDFNNDQKKILRKIKKKYSLDNIISKLTEISKLKPIVLGEPIIDEYIKVNVKGIGSKSPILAGKYIDKTEYAGGALVIANHLDALGCKTEILLPRKTKNKKDEIIYNKLNRNIKKNYINFSNWIIPRKTRFLNQYKSEKLFEYYKIAENISTSKNYEKLIIDRINKIKNDKSILLLADFGHHYFSKKLINNLCSLKIYKSINVQSNSANYGFNLYTKYKKFDFITLDERELRLTENDSVNSIYDLLKNSYKLKKINSNGVLTLGSNGSVYFSKNNFYQCPTFIKDPKDSVGSGDAYYSIASLLNFVNCDPELITFLCNCYAGLKTRVVGNLPVNKLKFVNYIKSILS